MRSAGRVANLALKSASPSLSCPGFTKYKLDRNVRRELRERGSKLFGSIYQHEAGTALIQLLEALLDTIHVKGNGASNDALLFEVISFITSNKLLLIQHI